ncbi:cytochrome c(L), periplasmic [Methylocystis sp. MJC1]|uniref:cytochrome c(L), periplasmic n=1 Tax=Methylocystis sp. MJC1 TaxID=2654282 RepID=UPI0013EBD431|nr:cytochrome c(L), periplasmic [Methylocystis sp. MJC1]KAF2989943.1 Cytochrome c-L [Methylocystis sp. MJC1]MBU6528849.1 cytochrome c(L), periplasmic [Methylocystis sp. MJC1]UZX11733.1 cytochrome c(L), periplasmic [Methylocystis sp. MJC1]
MFNQKKKAARIVVAAIGAFVAVTAALAQSAITFRNTITGGVLNFNDALPEGKDTPAVKEFMTTAQNPYNEDMSCLKQGEQIFLSACSGCHGHLGEGKIGPGLNDAYWTYPQNETDEGLFSTIYGGAQASMGPQYQNLQLDEMLKVMAWVRHLFKEAPEKATWLTDAQRKSFKPYPGHETLPENPTGKCQVKK